METKVKEKKEKVKKSVEINEEEVIEQPKKRRSPGYSKTKGNVYERQIVKELKELTKNEIAHFKLTGTTPSEERFSCAWFITCPKSFNLFVMRKSFEAFES